MSQIKVVIDEDRCGNVYLQFASFDDFQDPADEEAYWESLINSDIEDDYEDLEYNPEL